VAVAEVILIFTYDYLYVLVIEEENLRMIQYVYRSPLPWSLGVSSILPSIRAIPRGHFEQNRLLPSFWDEVKMRINFFQKSE
jgi:hypothetical protein